jgi:hypothetical protein
MITHTENKKTVLIDGAGQVDFVKSKRARRLSISVRPFKPVRVAIPLRLSFKKAREYFDTNIEWVRKSSEHIRKIEQSHKTTVLDEPIVNKKYARQFLLGRLAQLADEHNFTYAKAAVRNQKTLWASCSHENNISLNINLIKLRPELIDYVILHELVHTRVKNHSKKFWAELDRYVPGSKKLDKLLRNHHLGL